MTEATHSIPRVTRPGTVWVIVQYRDGEDAGEYTGIYHADIACPAVRVWADAAYHGTRIVEVERSTGDLLVEWLQTSVAANAEWTRGAPEHRRLRWSDWRPCLRCGRVPESSIETCSRCFLTQCDCDES